MKKQYFFIIPLAILVVSAGFLRWAIFGDHSSIAQTDLLASLSVNQIVPQGPAEASLIAVGDIMLSRGVAVKIKQNNSNDYPFLNVKDYLKTGDIVFGNLETPIATGREIKPGELTFRSEPGLEKNLKESNFSILSLANNHTMNFGENGLKETFDLLNSQGIKYAGAGNNANEANAPAIIESNGFKFAFLAYSYSSMIPASYGAIDTRAGIAFMDIEKMKIAVAEAKRQVDFVIVSMHAGTEYIYTPIQEQTEFARAAIDSGADMVIGHHPHVVQEMEKYNGKYIFYSLGNFIFDQMWSVPTREGIVMKATFEKSGVKKIELSPVLIQNYAQPEFIDLSEATDIFKRLAYDIEGDSIIVWKSGKN
ncbi:MAG: CapA family protein [Candidatus Paceibacterota bacterium]